MVIIWEAEINSELSCLPEPDNRKDRYAGTQQLSEFLYALLIIKIHMIPPVPLVNYRSCVANEEVTNIRNSWHMAYYIYNNVGTDKKGGQVINQS